MVGTGLLVRLSASISSPHCLYSPSLGSKTGWMVSFDPSASQRGTPHDTRGKAIRVEAYSQKALWNTIAVILKITYYCMRVSNTNILLIFIY